MALSGQNEVQLLARVGRCRLRFTCALLPTVSNCTQLKNTHDDVILHVCGVDKVWKGPVILSFQRKGLFWSNGAALGDIDIWCSVRHTCRHFISTSSHRHIALRFSNLSHFMIPPRGNLKVYANILKFALPGKAQGIEIRKWNTSMEFWKSNNDKKKIRKTLRCSEWRSFIMCSVPSTVSE